MNALNNVFMTSEMKGFVVAVTGFVLGKMDLLLPALEALSFTVSIATGAITLINHYRKKRKGE
ncbi:MAG: hypothetical protein MK172_08720 [Verrucomicrobiales bacterium]|nr:hypothetical protein [Verrucomicrobiales bacterium]